MIWKSTLIAFILSLLPITGDTKMHLSLLLTELLGSVAIVTYLMNKFNWFRKQEITISSEKPEGGRNPIYDKFQEYLAYKFKQHLSSYELVPKNGDVEFSIKDMQGKTFEDEFEKHIITLQISKTDSIINLKENTKYIIIKSKTANSDIIKKYVQKIMHLKIDSKGLIKVYRPIVKGNKKDETSIEWESVKVQTTKSLSNTIYSGSVIKELFDDVHKFMNDEAWYISRGIPYKRGYLLHGTPGTGKTAAAKILANMYDIPVFCLDLTTIKDNTTLIKLMTELNYYVHYKKYILLMEDVERSEFFKDRYEKNSKLTMDCLLNIIDGIVEPHGRIIIMSANNTSKLDYYPALLRPGRIDKTIEITYCNKEQVIKLYDLFFHDFDYQPDWTKWKLNEKLTPAFIMKLLQENMTEPKLFIHLIADATQSDNDTVELDDSFQEILDAAKKEIEEHAVKDVTEDRWGRRRLRRRGNRIKADIKTRVTRTKRNIRRQTNYLASANKRLAAATSKLPALLEKLKKEEKIKLQEKLKRKASNKLKWQKNNPEPNSDEEEYETPAFLLNSIAANAVAADVIVTYEVIEEPCNNQLPI